MPDSPNGSFVNTHGLTELGYKILLDRYAVKDLNRENINVGDTVIAIIKGDGADTRQKREIGVVLSIENQMAEVRLFPSDETITLPIAHIDKPVETTPHEIHTRLAKALAEYETDKGSWQSKFEWLLDDWKFVPGGRIMTAVGSDQNLTSYNCFVIPSPKDSRGGIFQALSNMAEIMSRGGGVGFNASSMRPRNAPVYGVNGRSSGSVSWAALFSYVTGLIEQSGSRRGALMLILNDWHPDIFDFINSKRTAGKIENANISVGASDKFMEAVKKDGKWLLWFPDTSHPEYDEKWDGNLDKWTDAGLPTIHYGKPSGEWDGKTIIPNGEPFPARTLWNAIIESAWSSAEPGLWFNERSNKMSNSWYFNPLVSTNPCGEQPLAGWSVCNLGALNLSQFYDANNRSVDWDKLHDATKIGVRFLDNVISDSYYFFSENEQQAKNERRIGLGIMGLAELLIKCEIAYGSDLGIKMTERIFKHIAMSAYEASVELAEEKGAFPMFRAEQFLQSGFMRQMADSEGSVPRSIIDGIREHGIRNVTLLTVAPTGSTGTMVNTSTGIEPFFSWNYYRQGRLGFHEENARVVQDYADNHPEWDGNYSTLPEWFVSAMDLTPLEHAQMQGAAQKWVDSAISKTVNAPNEYTVEQTSDLYMALYDLGCKGGTIYRDGSRHEQVLMLKKDDKASDKEDGDIATDKQDGVLVDERVPDRATDRFKVNATVSGVKFAEFYAPEEKLPDDMSARRIKGTSPYGTVFVTVSEDNNGNPCEVFITIGKSGSDIQAQAEATGRLISTALRSQPPSLRGNMLEKMASQMVGIGGARQVGFGIRRVVSLPDAIGSILFNYVASKGEQVAITPDHSGVKEIDIDKLSVYYNDDGVPVHATLKDDDRQEALEEATAINEVDYKIIGDIEEAIKAHAAQTIENVILKGADLCPECHNNTLVKADGCKKCGVCGYSEC